MIAKSIVKTLDSVVQMYLNSIGDSLDDFIEVNTALDDFNFVTKKGYMCTLISIDGSLEENNYYPDYRAKTDLFSSTIGNYFNDNDHMMQVVYRKINGGEEKIIKDSLTTAQARAKKIGLHIEGLFDSQVKTFAKKISNEKVVIALWTKTGTMSSLDYAKDQIELESSAKELQSKDSPQNLVSGYRKVITEHNEFVNSVIKSLYSISVITTKLTRHKAVNNMISTLSPELQEEIDVIFPDSDYYARGKESLFGKDHKVSEALWPSIAQQIIPEDEVNIDTTARVVQIGSKLFSTFEIDTPPRNLVTFNALTEHVRSDVPYQISFFIDSSISFSFFWKSALSRFPIPATNSRISKTIKATDQLKLIGEPNVEYKISVSTWSNDYEKLCDQREHLISSMAKWGSARSREYKGSPIKAMLNSAAGLNTQTFGGTVYAPLKGVAPQLPLSRRISLWKKSMLSFLADGGKLFPYSPTSSSFQKYWNIGVLADMGSGKSVLLQCIALTHMLTNNEKGLMPMVGYLDIGFSSKGVVDTLRALSERDSRNKYLHLTLQNHENHAFNIHDTQLGCREPDADQSKFILNFYLTLLTPIGEKKPDSNLEALLQQAIKDAYIYTNDDNKPKEYRESTLPEIDEFLEEQGVDIQQLSWWEAVDYLFDKNKVTLAQKAQRYAVPTIQDVIAQFNLSNSIKNTYETATIENSDETLINYTQRLLTQAIDAYPLISKPTKIDVEGANFIVLDLNDVAKGKGESGKKTTSIFYNLGRFIVTRNFFITIELLNHVPERYMKYHTKRVDVVKTIPKLMVYDEFHRVSWLDSMVSQIVEEMREGRKWNLSILMASQLLKDFSDEIKHLMSSKFLLSNSVDEPSVVGKSFGLNRHLMNYFKTYCTGPDGANGTPMIAQIKLKKRYINQSFRFIISPYLYWITTSDATDSSFKSFAVQRLGGKVALEKLSEKFPYGVRSVIEEITDNHPDPEAREQPQEFLFKSMFE
ncbi:hypothetical protein [Vibrio crassostreae]|uniref:hypothetical protein n=1 Tax=Vibrio crassostreae TaxID=246167 RepID=UPI001B305432|nr:hypothetical protein [Vibrio crassostreae]